MPKIKVSEKALAHLSRGLYRSPASTLRELVSNAWDANATIVRIDTNHPMFMQLSIEDNGDGFTKDDFRRIMQGGIGNSEKRPLEKPLINQRPIVGRFGIGLLGIAQISGAFTIASKPKEGEGFYARVTLYDFLKEKLDDKDPELVSDQEILVGEFEFLDYEPKNHKKGTLIIANDVHPAFLKTFKESLEFDKYVSPPRNDWKKFIKITQGVHSLQELGDYWRLLWEVAATVPVPYISDRAVPGALVREDQSLLESYNFQVLIDSIHIMKPLYFFGNSGGYTTLKIPKTEMDVYGKKLAFHGYLLVQEGSQLFPDELRGIMVRVKNVGVGYYDQALLDYRYNEGPRSRWLTGEIFVDEGLENAINIDRDSFNKFHPEYRELQKFVHAELRNRVFPETYKNIEKRSQKRARDKNRKRTEYLESVFSRKFEREVEIKQASDFDVAQSKSHVEITANRRKSILSIPRSENIEVKKQNQQLLTAVLTVFEIAMQEKTNEEKRKTFARLLLDLLKGW